MRNLDELYKGASPYRRGLIRRILEIADDNPFVYAMLSSWRHGTVDDNALWLAMSAHLAEQNDQLMKLALRQAAVGAQPSLVIQVPPGQEGSLKAFDEDGGIQSFLKIGEDPDAGTK